MKKVALVGRVNVGKSTLFNSLTGKNISLVGDTPALTRDYQEHLASLFNIDFILIDTPGFVVSNDVISQCTNSKLKQVVNDCDLVFLVCNAKEGITSLDLKILQFLRQQGKKFACLVNKSDGKNALKNNLSTFYELGCDLIFISGMSKDGFEDFANYLKNNLSDQDKNLEMATSSEEGNFKLAIFGKPNVGKSTLINSLLGYERLVVSDVPGTTRDAVHLDLNGVTVIDTAGISKKLNKKSEIERISAKRSMNSIDSNIIILAVFDASQGITKQDLLIVSSILEKGNSVIIGINKIDLLPDYKGLYNRIVNDVHESIAQVKNLPVMIFSALEGKGIDKIVEKAKSLYEVANQKLSSRKLNDYLQKLRDKYSLGGRRIALKYITQIGVNPLRFIIFANTEIPETYRRYVKNSISEHFGLSEVPIMIEYRKNHNPYVKNN